MPVDHVRPDPHPCARPTGGGRLDLYSQEFAGTVLAEQMTHALHHLTVRDALRVIATAVGRERVGRHGRSSRPSGRPSYRSSAAGARSGIMPSLSRIVRTHSRPARAGTSETGRVRSAARAEAGP